MPASKPEPKNTPSPGEEWYKLVRDIVLFVAGLLGVAYEAITPGETRIPLLVMYATMLGLPAIFRFPQQSQKDMTDE